MPWERIRHFWSGLQMDYDLWNASPKTQAQTGTIQSRGTSRRACTDAHQRCRVNLLLSLLEYINWVTITPRGGNPKNKITSGKKASVIIGAAQIISALLADQLAPMPSQPIGTVRTVNRMVLRRRLGFGVDLPLFHLLRLDKLHREKTTAFHFGAKGRFGHY